MLTMPDKPFRILPRLNADNEFFWTSGADGKLRFRRCQDCGYYIHPATPICPECLSKRIETEVVSGRATLLTFTENHQPWIPGFPTPYVIAIVEMVEQEGLRLTTNIVGVPAEELVIGMPLRVKFESYDDVFIPLFEPELQ